MAEFDGCDLKVTSLVQFTKFWPRSGSGALARFQSLTTANRGLLNIATKKNRRWQVSFVLHCIGSIGSLKYIGICHHLAISQGWELSSY